MRADPTIPASVDYDVLSRLQILLKDQFAVALSKACDNTQSYIYLVNTAIQAQHWDDARAAAHKIASSAGAFGLLDVVNDARLIEYTTTTSGDAWLKLYHDLDAQFQNTLVVLQPFLHGAG